MNLFKGRLLRQANHIWFQGNGFTSDLGQGTIQVLDVEAELGIRPEDITFGDAERAGLKARVDLVSNVGSETYVHVRLGHEHCVVRAPKNAFYPVGEAVVLVFDPEKINLFMEGKRIWPSDEQP
jgi:ABC-type sugar transport system ATPase subunit